MTAVADAEDLIEREWPFDGPHDSETVVSAAHALAALVRYLDNATQPRLAPTTLPYGPTVRRVLFGVSHALGGMDQLFTQLRERMSTLADDSPMYDDRRDRPAVQTVDEVVTALDEARCDLLELITRVQVACSAVDHLGHD